MFKTGITDTNKKKESVQQKSTNQIAERQNNNTTTDQVKEKGRQLSESAIPVQHKDVASMKSKNQMKPFESDNNPISRKSLENLDFEFNTTTDGEKLKEIIDILLNIIRIEGGLQNWQIMWIESGLGKIKDHDIGEYSKIFLKEYSNLETKIGNDFTMYKEDALKIYNKINDENWKPIETVKDAEDYLLLTELKKEIDDFLELYAIEYAPLSFTLNQSEIDELINNLEKDIDSFSSVYENGNDRIIENFKSSFEHIQNIGIDSIKDKFDSNKLRKDKKDSFDEKMDNLVDDEEKAKLDPPYKSGDNLRYRNFHYYSLFDDGLKDKHEINSNDVKQGQLGNCYYLSAIASIAEVNPDFFKSVIEEVSNQKNNYKILFYLENKEKKGYKKHEVVVDSDLPSLDNKPYYAGKGDSELWVMLLEKALAKLFGHYESVESGSPDFSLSLLTGKETETIDLSTISEDDLLQKLTENESSRPIVFGTKSKTSDPNVIESHGYYLIGINKDNSLKLGNPHGENHIESIQLQTILSNFSNVYIGEIP